MYVPHKFKELLDTLAHISYKKTEKVWRSGNFSTFAFEYVNK